VREREDPPPNGTVSRPRGQERCGSQTFEQQLLLRGEFLEVAAVVGCVAACWTCWTTTATWVTVFGSAWFLSYYCITRSLTYSRSTSLLQKAENCCTTFQKSFVGISALSLRHSRRRLHRIFAPYLRHSSFVRWGVISCCFPWVFPAQNQSEPRRQAVITTVIVHLLYRY